MNQRIASVAIFMLIAFLVLLAGLSYWQVFQGEALASHPANRRLFNWEEKVVRGGIFSSDGEILALTQLKNNRVIGRTYPQGSLASHVIGYTSKKLGMSGLEAARAGDLLGTIGWTRFRNRLQLLNAGLGHGNNVVVTIDTRMQRLAEQLLLNRRGSVVVLKPASGELLVLASAPGFDPNTIEEHWEDLQHRTDSPLLNRAVNGLYAPGSIFKVVTLTAALRAKPAVRDQTYICPGYLVIDGRILKDNAVHGQLDLQEALAVSCNVTFANLGLEAGEQILRQTARSFGFEQVIPMELPVTPSRLANGDFASSDNALAEAAIGQGTVTVTPLQMALIAGAVAQNGRIMEPLLVKKVESNTGAVLKEYRSEQWLEPLTAEQADFLAQAMVEAVRSGTARAAAVTGMEIAGKTGSAENPSGPTHSWFIGFGGNGRDTIALAIVLENAGTGGSVAAPMARELFDLYRQLDGQ